MFIFNLQALKCLKNASKPIKFLAIISKNYQTFLIITVLTKPLLSSSHQAILVTSKEGKAKSKAQRVKGSGNATNP